MKTMGLLAGMSWESSLEYYKIINQGIKTKLGKSHSAKILMYSFDFDQLENLQHTGDWDTLTHLMVEQASKLTSAGADFIVICSNTMHKMADEIEQETQVPVVHIADATAESVRARGIKRVGLLGTQFTMEQDFYKGRLAKNFGLEVLIPSEQDRKIVHDIIYSELVLGRIEESSRQRYLEIIESLIQNGAEGIILGCTEIGLLIQQQHVSVPVFDTTLLHATAAVEYALED